MREGPLKVYIAASREAAGDADVIAGKLQADDLLVVSHWHVNETKLVDPSNAQTRHDILKANLVDLEDADVVVALMDRCNPKATYAEIGYALAEGSLVVWVGPAATDDPSDDRLACIFDAHHHVLRVSSEDMIPDALARLRGRTRIVDGSIVGSQVGRLAERLLALVKQRSELIIETVGDRSVMESGTVIGGLLAHASVALTKQKLVTDWFNVAVDALALALLGGNTVGQYEEAPKPEVKPQSKAN